MDVLRLCCILCILQQQTVTGQQLVSHGKTVTSSSTHITTNGDVWSPDKAVDGDARQDPNGCNCCAATNKDYEPWFQIDLAKSYKIRRVHVIGRQQDTQSLRNMSIQLGERQSNGSILTRDTGDVQELDYTLPSPQSGRYLTLTLRDITQFFVICELYVYADCDEGMYGIGCNLTCGNCLNDAICDSEDGKCTSCVAGYTGDTCHTECSDYFFGINCNKRCYCAKGPCDKTSGGCPTGGCTAGYEGDRCDTPCSAGTFGINCSETCGSCYNNADCDIFSGNCQQCAPGYKLNRCKEECDDYTYGQGCAERCGNCLNNEVCDKIDGRCTECAAGYKGVKCINACSDGTYGKDCSEVCGSCYNNDVCDRVSGNCQRCAPGYKLDRCKEACHTGTFGENCSMFCGHCAGGESCDAATGICARGCSPGYTGTFCNQSCPDGFYGVKCQLACGNCLHQSVCIKDTGNCPVGCDPGFIGPLCHRECDDGTFGDGCTSICGNCHNGEACNKQNGSCQSCECGYKGHDCKSRIGNANIDTHSSDSSAWPNSIAIVGGTTACILVIEGVVFVILFLIRKRRQSPKKDAADHSNPYELPNRRVSEHNYDTATATYENADQIL